MNEIGGGKRVCVCVCVCVCAEDLQVSIQT